MSKAYENNCLVDGDYRYRRSTIFSSRCQR